MKRRRVKMNLVESPLILCDGASKPETGKTLKGTPFRVYQRKTQRMKMILTCLVKNQKARKMLKLLSGIPL